MLRLTEHGWPETPDWIKRGFKDQSYMGFLNAAPRELWDTTCRCHGKEFPGWKLHVGRNMWVCGSCEKPSPANLLYNVLCIWCETWYTIQTCPVAGEPSSSEYKAAVKVLMQTPCSECGGDNDARTEVSLF